MALVSLRKGTFAKRFAVVRSRLRYRLRILQQYAIILGGHLSRYQRLTRLDSPIGIWLLLWPTLWALWIA